MKILVTGHKGYIGSHLYKELIKQNHEVVGIDIKQGDDILYCLPDEEFDFVFHLAACPRVGYSVSKPSYTLRQNVFVTSVLGILMPTQKISHLEELIQLPFAPGWK